MANPIIKIKRGSTAPSTTLQAGEFAIDQAAKNLYLGVEVGGVVTNEIVGGEGTFAKKSYVDSEITALGTALVYKGKVDIGAAHFVDADLNGAPGTQWEPPKTGFYYEIGTVTGGGKFKYGSPQTEMELASGDALIKTATGWQRLLGGGSISSIVASLGSVFSYKGKIASFFVPATGFPFPLDLSTLSQDTGSYYSIDYDYPGNGNPNTGAVEATWTEGGVPKTFLLKIGDAIVKTTSGWEKIDNVDAVVRGTLGEIIVTGDENLGYSVAIAQPFKDLVQNIDSAGTIAGTTQINGEVLLKAPSGSPGTKIKDVFGGALVIGNDGILVGASYGQAVVSAINASAPDLSLNGAKVNIGGSFNPSVWPPVGNFTDDATEVRINSVVVKGSASGTTTLEDFVIDGGSY